MSSSIPIFCYKQIPAIRVTIIYDSALPRGADVSSARRPVDDCSCSFLGRFNADFSGKEPALDSTVRLIGQIPLLACWKLTTTRAALIFPREIVLERILERILSF